MMRFRKLLMLALMVSVLGIACDNDDEDDPMPKDPNEAEVVDVDRFSDEAGTLFKRSENPDLPEADESIDFDQPPFITKGLGPGGELIEYYNFDVQPTEPAPIYLLFREGDNTPVAGQLNIIDVIPGDQGYNDFWQVHRVTVPEDYEANVVSSKSGIDENGYEIQATQTVVNCPVVPEGSQASKRYQDGEAGLIRGWYKDKIVYYFAFQEKDLTVNANDMISTSPIYVAFNTNPGQAGGGPPSGFMTEQGNMQTHNVVATIPSDSGYSPLWMVNIYDNAEFDQVSDLSSATNATILVNGAANVNCPVVSVE